MTVRIFTTPGGERLAIMPEAEYLAMIEAIEDRADIETIKRFDEARARGEVELFPDIVAKRLIDGESPVRVFREHRGMSAGDLARAAGVSQAFISQIESGARTGSTETLRKIAEALRVSLDDLV